MVEVFGVAARALHDRQLPGGALRLAAHGGRCLRASTGGASGERQRGSRGNRSKTGGQLAAGGCFLLEAVGKGLETGRQRKLRRAQGSGGRGGSRRPRWRGAC